MQQRAGLQAMWVLWVCLGMAQALPSEARQEISLPACPGPATGQRFIPNYDHAYEWRHDGKLRRIKLSREEVTDAYLTLTLDYGLSGQLLKVEKSSQGMGGVTGRIWLLKSGQVVSAQGYDRLRRKQEVRRTLPLSSLPALYRASPTKAWYRQLVCHTLPHP